MTNTTETGAARTTAGYIVWITGFPAAGKTTLARALRTRLQQDRIACCMLDSDDVRREIKPSHGYDSAGRAAFYETLANLAAMLARQGLVVIVPATANLRAYRNRARILAPHYVEVHVKTPVSECAERDPKGLYGRANTRSDVALPGVNAPYEPPQAPDVCATGGFDASAIDAIAALVSP